MTTRSERGGGGRNALFFSLSFSWKLLHNRRHNANNNNRTHSYTCVRACVRACVGARDKAEEEGFAVSQSIHGRIHIRTLQYFHLIKSILSRRAQQALQDRAGPGGSRTRERQCGRIHGSHTLGRTGWPRPTTATRRGMGEEGDDGVVPRRGLQHHVQLLRLLKRYGQPVPWRFRCRLQACQI